MIRFLLLYALTFGVFLALAYLLMYLCLSTFIVSDWARFAYFAGFGALGHEIVIAVAEEF